MTYRPYILLFLLAALIVGPLPAEEVTLSWDAVTMDVSGTALVEPPVYRIDWDGPGVFTNIAETGETTVSVPALLNDWIEYQVYAVIRGEWQSETTTQSWEIVSDPAWIRVRVHKKPKKPGAVWVLQ